MNFFFSIRQYMLIMLAVIITVSFSNAQVQLTENFDSGNSIPTSSGSAPSSPTNYVCTSGTWTLYKSYRHGTSNHSAPYAIRLLKVTDAAASYAVSPVLNSVGTISFWGYGSTSKPIYLYKTTDNGSTWTLIDSAFTGAGTFVQTNVVVNDPSPNIRIKFVNGTVTVNDLNFDDVEITSYTTDATIILSQTSLPSFGFVVSGNSSTSASYSLSAHHLTANVKVKAPSGFKVSLDNSTFFDSLEIARAGDSIPNTNIYVQFSPTSASGTAAGNIIHESSGAVTQNLSVSGIAVAIEPTIQSSISFGTVTGYAITVNFSGGNGTNRILVARSESPVSWSPTDGESISGVNSDFSIASDKGVGNKVVYDGTGSSVNVSGLYPSTAYHFAVYEYNVGTNNSQNYNTISPGTGTQNTIAVPTIVVNPTSLAFGNVLIDSTSIDKTYTLSANTLSPSTGNITVLAPTGYEVSVTSGSGFSQSILVPYSSGTLASTIIYVRFKPITLTNYSGSITNSGGGAVSETVSVSGNGINPAEQNVLQAEDGLMINGKILTDYAGYTGWGYVDLIDKTGSWMEVTFRRVNASSDTLTIYYANGSGGSRSLELYLNDGSLGALSFPTTANWLSWSSVKTVIAFSAGINRIRLQTTGSGQNPNIDYFFIGGSEAIPVYKLNLYKSGNGIVNANPSQTYYDAGTQVQLSASPSGNNIFSKWIGAEESTNTSFSIAMNRHKTMVGVMLDTTNFAGFTYESSPAGFASMNMLGNNGTTGGAGGDVVYVNTSKELYDLMLLRLDASHTYNFDPITVYIVGTLSADPAFSEMLDVKDTYDVSIIGVGNDAIITGFGLKIYRSVNVIIRNIKFASCPDDGITIDAGDDETLGHHIWIDHCTFTEIPPSGYPANGPYDAALDVTHAAAYVTISWNHFYKNDKNSLVGNSDGATGDVTLKVTYHHNYFDSTIQRNPRVRFGKAHAFNNYYRKNTIYSVSSNTYADVVVEGNYFVDCPIPTESGRDGGTQGDIIEYNNVFVNCGTPEVVGTAFDPAAYYSYNVDPPSSIPELVSKFAGSGKHDFSPQVVSVNKTLNVTTLIEGFYNGSTMIPDTVTISLHSSAAPYSLIEQSSIVLNSAGSGSADFSSVSDGVDYYIVIKHRNSIETWSKNPQQFSSGLLSYDFTIAQTQAYGDNLKQFGTKWCIYSGDVNQDGVVDLLDMIDSDNDSYHFAFGYLPTDVNGDMNVDLLDMIIVDNNSFNFIGSLSPGGAFMSRNKIRFNKNSLIINKFN